MTCLPRVNSSGYTEGTVIIFDSGKLTKICLQIKIVIKKRSKNDNANFEVLRAVLLTIQGFWNAMPCRLVKLHLLGPVKRR